MSVQRSVHIDAEIVSIGQFDHTQKWEGKVAVERTLDGRFCIGNPTQSGFESITVAFDDLREAVQALSGQEPER